MLEIERISKQFGHFVANDDISFSLPPGRVVGILGPNGAGKSTLLRQIAGILTPDSGQVRLDGQSVATYGPRLYTKLACVFEDSALMYRTIPGWENLRYQGALYRLGKRETFARAEAMLEALRLKSHMGQRVGDWSRGTQQKLALVEAALIRPEVLVLDEPTLGLDVVSKRDFLGLCRQLCQQGASIVLASHQSEVIAALADDIVLIAQGRVRWQGALTDFVRDHSPDPARPRELEAILLDEFDDILGAGSDGETAADPTGSAATATVAALEDN